MQETAFLKTLYLTFQTIKVGQFEGMSATGATAPRGFVFTASGELVQDVRVATPVEEQLPASAEDGRTSRAGKSNEGAEAKQQRRTDVPSAGVGATQDDDVGAKGDENAAKKIAIENFGKLLSTLSSKVCRLCRWPNSG